MLITPEERVEGLPFAERRQVKVKPKPIKPSSINSRTTRLHFVLVSNLEINCSQYRQLSLSPEMAAVVGGIHESQGSENSVETEDLARFAVQEYNKKEVM